MVWAAEAAAATELIFFMRAKTFPSLLLAAILQIVPICKDVCLQVLPSAPFAILWRWAVGAIAYGGYHAIAGASVTITSPSTAAATNGVPLNYRITVSTYYGGMIFSDSPLPSGLAVNSSTGFITGTPTVSGSFSSTMTVSQPGEPTITAPLTYNIAASDPGITTQPLDYTVSKGANVTFTVTPSGTAPFTYQWRFNGNSISGATTSSRLVSNVQSSNAGKYSVVISNSKGTVTSSSAILSVNEGVNFNDTFESGTLGNWTTAVSPATALTITTANHTAGGTKGAHLSNVLNKMYHNLSQPLEGRMRVTFWINNTSNHGYGEIRAYSGGVYNSGTLQQLFAIGGSGVAFSGNTGTLAGETLDATKYQGRVTAGSNTGWFNLNGAGCPGRSSGWHKFQIERSADGSTIKFYVDEVLGRTITLATYANMNCALIGYTGTGTSTAGDASFDDVLVEYLDPPGISVQPQSKTVVTAQNVSFSVTATNNPQSYAWSFNGNPIASATSSVLNLTAVDSADVGTYSVVVSNTVGGITSANATLTVNVPPSISTPPQSQTVKSGLNANFSVIAAGTSPLSYQWRFNGTNLSAATLSSLSVTSVQPDDAGSYSVVVSNVAGTLTSANAILTVTVPPSISTPPQNQTIKVGATANFTVLAAGTSPLSYRWRFNGTTISGATASSLILTNIQTDDAGSYSVIVTNVVGTATSANAILTVTIPPSISTPPQSQTIKEGLDATFSVVATGTAPLSYKWKFNGGNIPGATTSSLSLTNVQTSNNGSYTVIITNVAGTATSSAAILTVTPSALLQFENPVSDGTSLQFNLVGETNLTLTIESSSNLIDWNIVTNLTNTGGTLQFNAPIDLEPSRFYRAHSP